MTLDITKVCKANHHQLSAIMNRVEKAKAERARQELQNPQIPNKKGRSKP